MLAEKPFDPDEFKTFLRAYVARVPLTAEARDDEFRALIRWWNREEVARSGWANLLGKHAELPPILELERYEAFRDESLRGRGFPELADTLLLIAPPAAPARAAAPPEDEAQPAVELDEPDDSPAPPTPGERFNHRPWTHRPHVREHIPVSAEDEASQNAFLAELGIAIDDVEYEPYAPKD